MLNTVFTSGTNMPLSSFRLFSLLLVVFILVAVPPTDSRMTKEDACEALCRDQMTDNVDNQVYMPSLTQRTERGCKLIGGWCTTLNKCSRGHPYTTQFCDRAQGQVCCIAT